jgi:general stress protein 26
MAQTLEPVFRDLIEGRHIATLATQNADGTIHLTAVWYLFADGHFFVATSAKTRKARNVAERQMASLMIDVRNAVQSGESLPQELLT